MVKGELEMSMLEYWSSLWQPLRDTANAIGQNTSTKLFLTITTMLASWFTSFVYDNLTGFLVLLGFVMIDLATGVWSAIKNKRFTSLQFRATVLKLLFYTLIIGCFNGLEKISDVFKLINLDTTALSYFAVTELLSILENVTQISTIQLPLWLTSKLRLFITTGKVEAEKTVEK